MFTENETLVLVDRLRVLNTVAWQMVDFVPPKGNTALLFSRSWNRSSSAKRPESINVRVDRSRSASVFGPAVDNPTVQLDPQNILQRFDSGFLKEPGKHLQIVFDLPFFDSLGFLKNNKVVEVFLDRFITDFGYVDIRRQVLLSQKGAYSNIIIFVSCFPSRRTPSKHRAASRKRRRYVPRHGSRRRNSTSPRSHRRFRSAPAASAAAA